MRTIAGAGRTLVVATLVLVLAGSASAASRTWDGGATTALASNPTNWVGDVAPVANDDIVLDGAANKNMTWNMTNMTVASWTQIGYLGTVTVTTVYGPAGFTNLPISGNCTISNGVWTHEVNPSTVTNVNNELYRLRVSIGGNLIVGPNAAVDVTGKGYVLQKGPGGGLSSRVGGSYGGPGHDEANASGSYKPSAPCYGSIVAPTNLGSGGSDSGDSGGGAIFLTVSGSIRNEGLICADGIYKTVAQGYDSGSGGSIYLIAGTLTGSGRIRANGGVCTRDGGGGGRIALVVTNAFDFSGFTGTNSAYGATGGGTGGPGGAGTIYLEKQGDISGNGQLIIDNYGGNKGYATTNAANASITRWYTDLSGVEAVTYEFSRIVLTNGANLNIGSNDTLIVTNTVLVGAGGISNGIWVSGGTLRVPSSFVYSNFFIGISATGSTFSPGTSLTILTNADFRVDKPHTMAGDVIVEAGGLLTHTTNANAEAYKINLTIAGSLTVRPGGSVDVTGRGYAQQNGPGGGGGNKVGGSYGGRGHDEVTIASKACYGSIIAPTNLGSGGGSAGDSGGGAIQLTVSGVITNDGLICADGKSTTYDSGSGGSIYLTAGTLAGTGTIRACGGVCGRDGGGGGRIALVVTNAPDFSGFAGSNAAFGAVGGSTGGSGGPGGAGTIYKQRAVDRPGRGTVLVDNNNKSGYTTDVPPGPPTITGEVNYASFYVANAATLKLTNNCTVGDIFVQSANAWLNLGGNVLTVNARKHAIGPGSATNVLNYGSILWAAQQSGIVIIVK